MSNLLPLKEDYMEWQSGKTKINHYNNQWFKGKNGQF